jgi:toxin ParE1/3/4
MGPSRPDIAPTLRCFRVGNYLIFYRQAQDGAEIVRVVHGARDLPALFDEA